MGSIEGWKRVRVRVRMNLMSATQKGHKHMTALKNHMVPARTITSQGFHLIIAVCFQRQNSSLFMLQINIMCRNKKHCNFYILQYPDFFFFLKISYFTVFLI